MRNVQERTCVFKQLGRSRLEIPEALSFTSNLPRSSKQFLRLGLPWDLRFVALRYLSLPLEGLAPGGAGSGEVADDDQFSVNIWSPEMNTWCFHFFSQWCFMTAFVFRVFCYVPWCHWCTLRTSRPWRIMWSTHWTWSWSFLFKGTWSLDWSWFIPSPVLKFGEWFHTEVRLTAFLFVVSLSNQCQCLLWIHLIFFVILKLMLSKHPGRNAECFRAKVPTSCGTRAGVLGWTKGVVCGSALKQSWNHE